MSSMNEYTISRTRESSLEWMTIVEGLIGDYYQQTDPVDDIDRIYRQEEVEEWLDLLEAYSQGNADYNDLINWQPDYLRDIDGFDDYLNDVRFKATWERNTNYNIAYCEENGCRDATMQRFYDKWKASGSPDSKDGMWSDEQFDEWLEEQDDGGGTDDGGPEDPGPEPPQTLDDILSELAEEQQVDREVVDGVVDMIETIKGSIPTDLESASDLIRGVLSSTVLGSALEECESWTGNTTTEGGLGVPSWTKCVNAGIFKIPGLDLPLPPGMVDISASVYDIIQKGEDIGESFEDFLEDPSGWLENVIDKAVEKVQEVWGDLQAGVDPKTIGGLSGILNDWIGNILGGYILSQVKDATSAIDPFLYAGDCLDPTFKEANKEYCEEALNEGALVDCSAQFGKTGGFVTSADQCGACENTDWTPTGANGECVDPDPKDCAGQNKVLNSDGTCGECLDSTLKDFGQGCEAPCQYDDTIAESNPECKEPWTDGGPTEETCAGQGRLHVPGDAATETDSSCGDCLPTHTDEDGTCTEWSDGGPTEEECQEEGKVHRPSTGTGRDSSCGGCLDGYELVNGQCTEEGLEEPCPGNQIRNEETRECEEPGPDFVEGGPCNTEDGKTGTYDSEGTCVPDWVNPGPSVQDCEALGKTHVSGDPSEQKASECGDCQNPKWDPIGDGGECVEKVCDESSFQEEVEEIITVPYGQPGPRLPGPAYAEVNGVCTKTTQTVVFEDPTQAQCEAEGKELSEDGKSCVEPTPCDNGATLESECTQCEDGSTPEKHEGGNCNNPLIPEVCGPETFTAESTVEVSVGAGEEREPTVQYVEQNKECTKVTTVYVQGPTIGPQNCADGKPPEENIGECVECPEGSQYPNASSLAACGGPPQECNAQTATKTVNLTETIPFGDPLPDPVTTYKDDGTQCVATTTTYVEGENPNPSVDCTTLNEDNYQECEGTKCDDGTYAKKGETCGDPLECLEITSENAEKCGQQLCNGVYIDKELPCVPVVPPEDCENPQTDEEKLACGWVECSNGRIAENLESCGDTSVTTCLDEAATNFNEEGPCKYGPTETCENGATDYPECTTCADGSLPDADLGCGGIDDPCDDPVYAAENPTECESLGPDCVDCTCAKYAAANPEECSPEPPEPPGGGGGGGGGGSQGQIEPIEIGISGDPELLARQQFPITDYLSGLFTGRR